MTGDVSTNPRVRFSLTARDRRKWRLVANRRCEKAQQLLVEIESVEMRAAQSEQLLRIGWLFPYRDAFRSVIENGEAASTLLYLADCPRAMTPVGVWLLGRIATRFWLLDLELFRDDPSPIVRRHVAKALSRLEAWHFLDDMAQRWSEDEHVQRAAARAKKGSISFHTRLARFTRHVEKSSDPAIRATSRMPFWSLSETWNGLPPKSAALIRRLLRRIHDLVHGTTA